MDGEGVACCDIECISGVGVAALFGLAYVGLGIKRTTWLMARTGCHLK